MTGIHSKQMIPLNVIQSMKTSNAVSKNELIYKEDYLRKIFSKCSDTRDRVLRSSETDPKDTITKTMNCQKACSYRGAKLLNGI